MHDLHNSKTSFNAVKDDSRLISSTITVIRSGQFSYIELVLLLMIKKSQ